MTSRSRDLYTNMFTVFLYPHFCPVAIGCYLKFIMSSGVMYSVKLILHICWCNMFCFSPVKFDNGESRIMEEISSSELIYINIILLSLFLNDYWLGSYWLWLSDSIQKLIKYLYFICLADYIIKWLYFIFLYYFTQCKTSN